MTLEHWLTASVSVNVLALVYSVYLTWWSSQREQHVRDIGRKVVTAINKMNAGYANILRSVKQSHSLSREGRREIVDLLKESKREHSELVLDIEERLTRSIDRTHSHRSVVNVGDTSTHVSGGLNNIGHTEVRGNQVHE